MKIPFMRKKDIEGIPHALTLREYNALQVEHILKHKWYLSQKFGREASMNEVMTSWNEDGFAEMFRRTFKVTTETGKTISDRKQVAI